MVDAVNSLIGFISDRPSWGNAKLRALGDGSLDFFSEFFGTYWCLDALIHDLGRASGRNVDDIWSEMVAEWEEEPALHNALALVVAMRIEHLEFQRLASELVTSRAASRLLALGAIHNFCADVLQHTARHRSTTVEDLLPILREQAAAFAAEE